VGDEKYGQAPVKSPWPNRLFLHARELRIPLQGSEEKLVINTPIPEEFQSVLALLRNED